MFVPSFRAGCYTTGISAYRPFDWRSLPFKCETFALGPTEFAYNTFDYEASFWGYCDVIHLALGAGLRDTDTPLASSRCVRRSSALLCLVSFSKAVGVLLVCPVSGMCLPFYWLRVNIGSRILLAISMYSMNGFDIISHCVLFEAQCRCLAPSCWNTELKMGLPC